MRIVLAGLFALLLLAVPEPAVAQFTSLQGEEYPSNQRLLEWVYAYRSKPDPGRVPEAVQAMKKLGLFRDSEKAEFFVGFIAGVLGQNQRKARRLIEGMFPMPPKEQAVIIKAIAWSGLSNWPELMHAFASRMPHRKALIDKYLSGEQPTLMMAPLETGPSVLYALWGYYVATGHYEPVARVIPALEWSRGGEEEEGGAFMRRVKSALNWSGGELDFNKANVGGTAKWTLVSHAERDRDLIDFYRIQVDYQSERVAAKLREVIAAAETFESERIRKEELAAIEVIRRRDPNAGFNRATTLGSVAIATGCVAATAAGQAAIAVPCIVTGAVYSGFVRFLKSGE
jgi:hypothetical protein